MKAMAEESDYAAVRVLESVPSYLQRRGPSRVAVRAKRTRQFALMESLSPQEPIPLPL